MKRLYCYVQIILPEIDRESVNIDFQNRKRLLKISLLKPYYFQKVLNLTPQGLNKLRREEYMLTHTDEYCDLILK